MDHDVTDWTIFGGLQVFYDTCSADWNIENENRHLYSIYSIDTKHRKYIAAYLALLGLSYRYGIPNFHVELQICSYGITIHFFRGVFGLKFLLQVKSHKI